MAGNEPSSRHRVVRVLVVTGEWVCDSAVHVGSGELSELTDSPVLRDEAGKPYLPGTSIGGALRSWIRSWCEDDALRTIREVFGGEEADGSASLLSIPDAPLTGMAKPELRDRVRLDARCGSAMNRGKFDLEVVPRGARFRMELRLHIYDVDEQERAGEYCKVLRTCIDALVRGDVALGGSTENGLGRGRLERLEVRDLDLRCREHMLAWLQRRIDLVTKLETLPSQPLELKAVDTFEIEAVLRLKTSLLIRTASEEAGGADVRQHQCGSDALVPGTSLRGPLRHRCGRILHALHPGVAENEREELVAKIFGPQTRDLGARTQIPLLRGNLRVGETLIPGGQGDFLLQARVAIDRLTGATRDSALFEEEAFWPKTDKGDMRIRLTLRKPENETIGLLLGAFKDLWLGDLPVGGEAGVGRGVFQGRSATIRHGAKTWVLTADSSPADVNCTGDLDLLNGYTDALLHWNRPAVAVPAVGEA
jgi:CRISPR/Cas system CSM-associated protein Csm3 (group 7 of RAMP superfamily)